MHQLFKLLVEIGQGIIAAIEADLGNGILIFHQLFTGIADAELTDKSRKGFVGAGLKIAAEGGRRHIGDAGHFLQHDILFEVEHDIIVYIAHPVLIHLLGSIGVADAGNVAVLGGFSQHMQDPQQLHQAFHPFQFR